MISSGDVAKPRMRDCKGECKTASRLLSPSSTLLPAGPGGYRETPYSTVHTHRSRVEQRIEHGSIIEHLPSQEYSLQAMDPSLLTTLLELDRRKTRTRRKCLEQNHRAIRAILEDSGATTLLQSCAIADEDIRQMLDECIASQASARSGRQEDDTKFSAARTLSRAELEAIKKDICARLALVKEELDRDCAEAPRMKSETAPCGARSFAHAGSAGRSKLPLLYLSLLPLSLLSLSLSLSREREPSRVPFWVDTVASIVVFILAFLATYYLQRSPVSSRLLPV
jgi:hypothetical protein